MTAPVLDLITPNAVSGLLHRAGLQRDETIGRQLKRGVLLPHTGGYRVSQRGTAAWHVMVTAYRSDELARARDYEQITAALVAAGYDAETHPNTVPSHALIVRRRRHPRPVEWAALEDLARRPRIVAPGGARLLTQQGIDGIPGDVVAALWRSGLAADLGRVPMMVWPDSDTRREGDGFVLGLTAAGVELLTARNKARRTRADWSLIARPNRWPAEAPALLDGDPGRDEITAARLLYQPVPAS